MRDNGAVRTKAVYLAIGVSMEGHKEILGLWISQTEGPNSGFRSLQSSKIAACRNLLACVDGLKGFPDAIEAVNPKATVQLCIVPMVRNSLNFVPWKVQREIASDLKPIYSAATADGAELRLSEFEDKWDRQYKPIGQSWRHNWARVIPFFDYPPAIRKVIYTTNAIESINMSQQKVTKARSSFPTDEAASKLFYRKRPADPPSIGRQLCIEFANGSSESILLFGQVGSLSSVSASQRAGSRPLSLAVANKL